MHKMANGKYHELFTLIVFHCLTLLEFGVTFSVTPLGLSETYRDIRIGNQVKFMGKSLLGVSWSRNLDAEKAQRKQLCPHIPEVIGYQYRFHNESKTCYKVGDKGPCGDNMVFFAYQTNAVFGQCDCNYNDNTRDLIMDSERNMCHFVYSRGYCKPGEWLTFTSTWEPICEPNKCIKFYENVDIINNAVIPEDMKEASVKAVSVEFVPYKNNKGSSFSCVPLGLSCKEKDMDEESFSQWGSLSHLPHQVQFIKGKLAPRCAPSSEHINWRYPIPKMQCLPGSFLIVNAKTNGKPKCEHRFEI